MRFVIVENDHYLSNYHKEYLIVRYKPIIAIRINLQLAYNYTYLYKYSLKHFLFLIKIQFFGIFINFVLVRYCRKLPNTCPIIANQHLIKGLKVTRRTRSNSNYRAGIFVLFSNSKIQRKRGCMMKAAYGEQPSSIFKGQVPGVRSDVNYFRVCNDSYYNSNSRWLWGWALVPFNICSVPTCQQFWRWRRGLHVSGP